MKQIRNSKYFMLIIFLLNVLITIFISVKLVGPLLILGLLVWTTPVVILFLSFRGVRRNFLEFHSDKYQEIKVALWQYVIFDFIINGV
jgi:hypothetical protein